jgi:hypothetical protein
MIMSDEFTPFEQATTVPEEPAAGSVIGFVKRYREDGPGYSFAAVHVHRLGWYLTGPKYAGEPVEWLDLLNFIGGWDEWKTIGVVVAWTPLVPGAPVNEVAK